MYLNLYCDEVRLVSASAADRCVFSLPGLSAAGFLLPLLRLDCRHTRQSIREPNQRSNEVALELPALASDLSFPFRQTEL